MRQIVIAAIALAVASPAAAQIAGDSGNQVRRPDVVGKPTGRDASKGKAGAGSGLMEEEGIFYFIKKPPAREPHKTR